MHTEFRPWFGKALTIAIGVVCAVGLVITAVRDGWSSAWRFGPWLVLLVGVVWALYWRPSIAVGTGGIRVVNVARTIEIPWERLTAIDTVWSLALVTAAGKFSVWAAPAPSAVASIRQSRRGHGVMRRDADVGDPSPSRPTAQSQLRRLTQEIQQSWDESRAAAGAEAGTAEGSAGKASAAGAEAGASGTGEDAGSAGTAEVTVRWHRTILLVGAGLVAIALIATFTG